MEGGDDFEESAPMKCCIPEFGARDVPTIGYVQEVDPLRLAPTCGADAPLGVERSPRTAHDCCMLLPPGSAGGQ
jgi:hypothetical protein